MNMSGSRSVADRSRVLELSEANRLLPVVNKLVSRLDRRVSLRHRLKNEIVVLQLVLDCSDDDQSAEFQEFLDKSMRFHRLAGQADALVDRLGGMGCVVRNRDARWVDFTFLRPDGLAFFCWRRAEESITHWHHMHESHSSRRLLEPSES
jgi:hypothetical protein